jgi:hypothetical protein
MTIVIAGAILTVAAAVLLGAGVLASILAGNPEKLPGLIAFAFGAGGLLLVSGLALMVGGLLSGRSKSGPEKRPNPRP